VPGRISGRPFLSAPGESRLRTPARRWYIFGALATVLPLANIFVMALKP
jgi:hypothetical protein